MQRSCSDDDRSRMDRESRARSAAVASEDASGDTHCTTILDEDLLDEAIRVDDRTVLPRLRQISDVHGAFRRVGTTDRATARTDAAVADAFAGVAR